MVLHNFVAHASPSRLASSAHDSVWVNDFAIQSDYSEFGLYIESNVHGHIQIVADNGVSQSVVEGRFEFFVFELDEIVESATIATGRMELPVNELRNFQLDFVKSNEGCPAYFIFTKVFHTNQSGVIGVYNNVVQLGTSSGDCDFILRINAPQISESSINTL